MKTKQGRAGIAVLAMVVLGCMLMGAGGISDNHGLAFGNGSTGESLIVAPDTSTAIRLDRKTKSWFVISATDSLSSYKTQVSQDGTYWYTVDFDSCPKGEAEPTGDFGANSGLYAGFYVRVIIDNLTAGGGPIGRATVMTLED